MRGREERERREGGRDGEEEEKSALLRRLVYSSRPGEASERGSVCREKRGEEGELLAAGPWVEEKEELT